MRQGMEGVYQERPHNRLLSASPSSNPSDAVAGSLLSEVRVKTVAFNTDCANTFHCYTFTM